DAGAGRALHRPGGQRLPARERGGAGMRTWLRFLALVAFAFWQGGFTFYAAVVVPIGRQVFGSDLDQAMVTRQATVWLNVAGAVTLLFLAADIAVTADPSGRRRLGRWLAWSGLAA